MKTTTKPSQRRPPGRPRSDESPASVEVIFEAALKAFATHGYDGVSLRTLARELGGSHNLLTGRFGSKEALWYATADWAFEPLVLQLATAFDPTVSDPVEQLRITMRAFLLYSAQRPELLGLMSIEGRQDTDRLSYVYNTYVQPALEPVHVGMAKRVGKQPPQHERANPDRDGNDQKHSVQTSTTSSNRSVRSRTPAASSFS